MRTTLLIAACLTLILKVDNVDAGPPCLSSRGKTCGPLRCTGRRLVASDKCYTNDLNALVPGLSLSGCIGSSGPSGTVDYLNTRGESDKPEVAIANAKALNDHPLFSDVPCIHYYFSNFYGNPTWWFAYHTEDDCRKALPTLLGLLDGTLNCTGDACTPTANRVCGTTTTTTTVTTTTTTVTATTTTPDGGLMDSGGLRFLIQKWCMLKNPCTPGKFCTLAQFLDVSNWAEQISFEEKYGKIEDWDTSGVDDFSNLFKSCGPGSFQHKCYRIPELSTYVAPPPDTSACESGRVLCCNRKCVRAGWIRDGDNDCKDGSDETTPEFMECQARECPATNACSNHGACKPGQQVKSPWFYSCICDDGWSGDDCETNDNDAASTTTTTKTVPVCYHAPTADGNVTVPCSSYRVAEQDTSSIHGPEVCQMGSPDLTKWNTTNVKDMSYMFPSGSSKSLFGNVPACKMKLNESDDDAAADDDGMRTCGPRRSSGIEKWDTRNVVNFEGMFMDLHSTTRTNVGTFNPDLSEWGTGSATNFASMFKNAQVDFSGGNFSKWNTSRGVHFQEMFRSAKIFNGDLSTWQTGNGVNFANMFKDACMFNSDLSKWTTGSAKNMIRMFAGAMNYNSPIGAWDVSKVSIVAGGGKYFDLAYPLCSKGTDYPSSSYSKGVCYYAKEDCDDWYKNKNPYCFCHDCLPREDFHGLTAMFHQSHFEYIVGDSDDDGNWGYETPPTMRFKSQCYRKDEEYKVDFEESNFAEVPAEMLDQYNGKIKDVIRNKWQGETVTGDSADMRICDNAARFGMWKLNESPFPSGSTGNDLSKVASSFFQDGALRFGCDCHVEEPGTYEDTSNGNGAEQLRVADIRQLYCSNKAKDGARCSQNDDCNSGNCGSGRCCAFRAPSNCDNVCGLSGMCFIEPTTSDRWDNELHLSTGNIFPKQMVGNASEFRKVQWNKQTGTEKPFPSTYIISRDSKPIDTQLRFHLKWLKQNTPASIADHLSVGQTAPQNFTFWEDDGGPGEIDFDINRGTVYAYPVLPGKYTAWLIAEDLKAPAVTFGLVPEIDQILIYKWELVVVDATPFTVESFRRTGSGNGVQYVEQSQPPTQKRCAFNEECAASQIKAINITNRNSGDGSYDVAYTVTSFAASDSNVEEGCKNLNLLINPDTGYMSATLANAGTDRYEQITCSVIFTAAQKFEASEILPQSADIEVFEITYQHDDTAFDANGPGSQGCTNGIKTDPVKFNQSFACDCSNSIYDGANCNITKSCSADESLDIADGTCKLFDVKVSSVRARTTEGVYTDPHNEDYFAVGSTYQISPFNFSVTSLSSGSSADVRYHAIPINVTLQPDGVGGSIASRPEKLPEGFFMKPESGDILIDFRENDAQLVYTISIQVEDNAGAMKEIETLVLNVKHPEVCKPTQSFQNGACVDFVLALDRSARDKASNESTVVYTDPEMMKSTFYTVNQTYRIAPYKIRENTTYSDGGRADLMFTMTSNDADGFFLNPKTGELQGTFAPFDLTNETRVFTIVLTAVDDGGAEQVVEELRMRVRHPDTDTSAYGPNNQTCSKNSNARDDIRFNKNYECDCYSGLTGPSCNDRVVCNPNESFNIIEEKCKPFELSISTKRERDDDVYTLPTAPEYFAIGKAYQFAPLHVFSVEPSSGSADDVRFIATINSIKDINEHSSAGNETLPSGFFIKAESGDILVDFRQEDNNKEYNISIQVEDAGNAKVVIEQLILSVKYLDVDPDHPSSAVMGPNSTTCKNGGRVFERDVSKPFDGFYDCDCDTIQYNGINCETATVCKPSQSFQNGACVDFVLALDRSARDKASNESTVVYTDPEMMKSTFYTVNQTYRIAPYKIRENTTYSDGGRADLMFTMTSNDADGFFLNPKTGELQGTFAPFDLTNETRVFTIVLTAVDDGGAEQVVEELRMRVRHPDTDTSAYGPNNQNCDHGAQVDDNLFDKKFSCNCENSGYEGAACTEADTASQEKQVLTIGIAGGVAAFALLATIIIYMCCKERNAKNDAIAALNRARKAYGLPIATKGINQSKNSQTTTNASFIGINVVDTVRDDKSNDNGDDYWEVTGSLDTFAGGDRASVQKSTKSTPAASHDFDSECGSEVDLDDMHPDSESGSEVDLDDMLTHVTSSRTAKQDQGVQQHDVSVDISAPAPAAPAPDAAAAGYTTNQTVYDDNDDGNEGGGATAPVPTVATTAIANSTTKKKSKRRRRGLSKFVAPTISLGKSTLAAKGLDVLLGIDPKTYMHVKRKVKVMLREFAKNGTAEDNRNIKTLLDGTYKHPPNGDGSPLTAEEIRGQSITMDELMASSAVQDAGLERHHVLALRLYTTSSYSSINNPMRSTPPVLPHPFAATLYYVSDAISRLREVQGKDAATRNETLVFWRGMKDLQMAEAFIRTGGSEMACMSTTSSREVAEDFAWSKSPLLFKFVSKSFMSHGADISFLSVYPGEKEWLYPPLTYLRPIRLYKETIGGTEYQVAEVEPVFPK